MSSEQQGFWEYKFAEPGSTTIRTEIHVPTDRFMITLIQTSEDGVTEVGAAFDRESTRRIYQGIGRYLAHGPYNEQDKDDE